MTGLIHLLSFFNDPNPTNSTEQQLFDLMANYKFDFGGGFQHTMNDIVNAFSICFALLFLFSGAVNWFLLKQKLDLKTIKGIVLINIIVFFICLVVMVNLTFLPPIICTALIVGGLLFTYISLRHENRIHIRSK